MKGKKLIVSALVATMVGAPVAVLNSTTSVMAEENITNSDEYTVVGPSVRVSKDYDKTAKQNQAGVKLPKVLLDGSAKAELRVIDPTGKDITDELNITDPSIQNVFKPTKLGVYTYQIVAYEGTTTQTSIASTYELTLEVTGDTGSIEMPDNSYYVVPTEFLKGKTLSVPVPTTFINDKEVVFDGDDEEVLEDASTAKIEARLVRSGSEDIVMTFNEEQGSSYDKLAYFSYTFANEDSVVGNYKLVYKLYKGGEVVAVSNSKTIKVRSSLTSDTLYISWANTPKKAANVGVAYNLVDVNATFVENSTDYVNAFTQITVTHQATGEEMVVDYEKMNFVPKYKGNYFVTYKAIIPSLGVSSNVLRYTITNVEDEVAPKIMLTGSYLVDSEGKNYIVDPADDQRKIYLNDLEEDTDELLYTVGDNSYMVRSYYKMSKVGDTDEYAVTVKLPAAYVIDNYSNSKNMKITRNLYLRTNTTESGRLKLIKSEDVEYAFNEVAEYTFSTKGTYGDGNYVVKYVATDESGMTTTSDYNITVKAHDDKNVVGEPTLTFSYDEEMVEDTDVITFDVPTATDKYDTNLLVKTYYTFEEPQVVDGELVLGTTGKELNYTYINDSGDYELDLNDILNVKHENTVSSQYIYLVSTASNSYDTKLTENKNFVYKKVLILGASIDTDAPVFDSVFKVQADSEVETTFNDALVELNKEEGQVITLTNKGYVDDAKKEAMFDQDDIVKIPTIKFTDADSFVNFEVKVTYESNGEVVELNALEAGYNVTCEEDSGEYVHTLSGASFRVSYAKTYTITVVATDSNGNVSFISYAVRVNDTQPPVIVVPNKSKFSTDIEVGTKFTVPAPQISDDGEVMDSADWSWSMVDPNGAKYSYTSNVRSFVPNILGTYVITYTAKDGSDNSNTSSEYRLNVVAEDAPVITLHGVIDEIDEIGWDYTDNATQQKRYIPKASAKDVNFAGAIIVDAPTVKNSKGEEVTVTEDGDKWVFTPNVQGTYTITYSAQGKFLNSTKQYTMVIGDGEAPTLDWENKAEDLATTVNVGDEWTFKFDMVKFDDNEDDMQAIIDEIMKDGVTSSSIEELSKYMTIKMKNPDNSTVSYTIADNGLKYTFDKAGSYTLTITLKDKAGNSTSNTYSYTITVNDEEVEETTEKSNDSVVGTVLIVLSVVILAGVVAYFAITTKQVESKSKNKKSKKSDEKKDK